MFSLVSLFGAYDTVKIWCADFVCDVFSNDVVTDTEKPTLMKFHLLFALILRTVNYNQGNNNKRNEI